MHRNSLFILKICLQKPSDPKLQGNGSRRISLSEFNIQVSIRAAVFEKISENWAKMPKNSLFILKIFLQKPSVPKLQRNGSRCLPHTFIYLAELNIQVAIRG